MLLVALLVANLAHIGAASVLRSNRGEQLKHCYNDFAAGPAAPMTFRAFLNESVPRLRLTKSWRSRKPGARQSWPLTIATPTSEERLQTVRMQCQRFTGPLVSAVHLPVLLSDTTQQARVAQRKLEARLERWFTEMERNPNACHLVILFFMEVVADRQMLHLVPINTLRNAAILAARTPLVAMIDADILISNSVHALLQDRARVGRMLAECKAQPTVWVMPAFEQSELRNKTLQYLILARALSVRPEAKRKLLSLRRDGYLLYFAHPFFKWGHHATNYSLWFARSEVYKVHFETRYEPWYIGCRNLVPAYDERYRGYHNDKMSHAALLSHMNTTFSVLPDVWLVHRPHEVSVLRIFNKTVSRRGHRHLSTAYDDLAKRVEWMPRHNVSYYKIFFRHVNLLWNRSCVHQPPAVPCEPVAGQPYGACKSALPWWKLGGSAQPGGSGRQAGVQRWQAGVQG